MLALFYFLGPPAHWADSVAHKPLRIGSDPVDLSQKYREELRRARSQAHAPSEREAPDGRFDGWVVSYKKAPDLGVELLLTATGKKWIDGQHFYWRLLDGKWNELRLPSKFILSEFQLVLRDDQVVILLSRRHPWWPYRDNYARFFKSLAGRELRPENGLYELRLPTGKLRYLFPGHVLVPSPDRRRVAFLRSAGISGSHSLHIFEIATYEVRTLAALTEGDPGSGISFKYAWLGDSRTLGLWGWLKGHNEDVEAVYTLDSGRFWDVSALD